MCYWTRERLIDSRMDGDTQVEPTGIDLCVDVLGILTGHLNLGYLQARYP
jgi:hypothetical protein